VILTDTGPLVALVNKNDPNHTQCVNATKRRMAALMDKYQDRPMDLADASLVTVAERLGMRRIFTLDSDCHIHRLADGSALECIP
jgi:predicted nucleic acid-binding protein